MTGGSHIRGSLFLFAAAFIWGTTFVAQSVGMERIGPFTYGAARFFLGMIFLGGLWLFLGGRRAAARAAQKYKSGWRAGMMAGLIMFVASGAQQFGMQYTTAGKAAFVTCLYIVFVPLTGLFLKKRVAPENWAGAFLALAGLFLLCVREDFSVGTGDGIIFLGSIFWTLHILFIDRNASDVDMIEMSLAQVTVAFLLNTVCAALLETCTAADIFDARASIFYSGVLSTGIAFTLQIAGQREAPPESASVIMSLESVFGALAGWQLLDESLSGREIAGCVLMAAGTFMTEAGGRFFVRNDAR